MVSKDDYCCCQFFLIYHGTYLIVLHSLIHGAYGIGIVITSHYKSVSDAINYTVVAASACFFPTAILIFWVSLYKSRRGAQFAGTVIVVVALFNVVMAILYLIKYFDFKANSNLDSSMFWERKRWVDSDDLPFTLWHVFTFILVVTDFIWLYYANVMCKYANFLSRMSNTHGSDASSARPTRA